MIKRIGNAMVVAMAAAVLMASPAAQAATTIDTSGFRLTWTEGVSNGNFDMTLLSDVNGTVRIGLETGLAGYSHDASLYGDGSNGDFATHYFAALVKEGYRITSMTISASVTGALYVETPGPCDTCSPGYLPGLAENRADLGLARVDPNEGYVSLLSASVANLNGTQVVEASRALQLDGEFVLYAQATDVVTAERAYRTDVATGEPVGQYFDALAAIDVRNMVLTVQVSPVPEPSTYAMVLAGLGVAGWAARRRRA